MGVFECKILSNDVINNDSIGDDEVVASDVSPRYFSYLDAPSHLYERSVGPSIGPSRVILKGENYA